MKQRDYQKSKLYDAEDVLKCAPLVSLDECREVLDRALRIVDRYCIPRPQSVQLRPGYGARHPFQRFNTITLPKFSRQPHIILHELAHVLIWSQYCTLSLPAGVPKAAAHGQHFAALYLWLVRKVLGNEQAEKLSASFLRVGVMFGDYETAKAAKR